MQSLFYPLSILSNRRIPLTTRLCAAHRLTMQTMSLCTTAVGNFRFYRAYSTMRVSRIIVILILPG